MPSPKLSMIAVNMKSIHKLPQTTYDNDKRSWINQSCGNIFTGYPQTTMVCVEETTELGRLGFINDGCFAFTTFASPLEEHNFARNEVCRIQGLQMKSFCSLVS